jgi:TrmH family RNA methyltransferase
MLITSRTNPKIKEIRRLFNRRHRQQAGLFFAEGLQLVQEAIAMQADISLLVLAPELLDEERAREVASLQERSHLPALQVTAEVLNSISPQDGHQGIAAVVRQPAAAGRWRLRGG